MSKTKRRTDYLKARESGFDMGYVSNNKVSEYNALYDPNMRHYFENRHVQEVSAFIILLTNSIAERQWAAAPCFHAYLTVRDLVY